jgi:hypothetical protein
MITWSHTMLSNFENCARKGYHLYIAKDLPKADTEAMRWGNAVHKALDKRIGQGFELPDEMVQYEPMAAAVLDKAHHLARDIKITTEQKLGVTTTGTATGFFDKDVWGRGAIDVLMVKEPVALIVDWKTGKRREDPKELETFALLLQATRPEIRNIYGVYVWLQDETIGQLHNISDTATTWLSINRQMQHINQMSKDNKFPPTPNPLCGYCDVMTCEFNRKKK